MKIFVETILTISIVGATCLNVLAKVCTFTKYCSKLSNTVKHRSHVWLREGCAVITSHNYQNLKQGDDSVTRRGMLVAPRDCHTRDTWPGWCEYALSITIIAAPAPWLAATHSGAARGNIAWQIEIFLFTPWISHGAKATLWQVMFYCEHKQITEVSWRMVIINMIKLNDIL